MDLGGVVRTLEDLAGLDILDDLLVGKAVVGLKGKAEDLPKENSEGPNVGLDGVLGVYASARTYL